MKAFLGIAILVCVFALSAGCNSGTMKGMGSDISNLGDKMQK
jgi:predicted small secreted protein